VISLRLREPSVLPGFGLSLGYATFYLSLVVLVPLGVLLWRAAGLSWAELVDVVGSPRALAAFRLSFGASLVAAALKALFGPLVAWVLVRYRPPGRAIVDALVDLPFALPTAVGGIALTAVYAPNGPIGRYLEAVGIKAAFSQLGVVIALTFIGLPFVVRTIQPVLRELDPEVEEAAATLGASRWSVVTRILLPGLAVPALTGFVLALARALGEYGSVIFISGNMPMKSEITPLLIMIQLEQYDYPAATAIALVFLVASFGLLLLVNRLTAAYAAPPGARGA